MKTKITAEQRAWLEYGRFLGRLHGDLKLSEWSHSEYGWGRFNWGESGERRALLAEARRALQKALSLSPSAGVPSHRERRPSMNNKLLKITAANALDLIEAAHKSARKGWPLMAGEYLRDALAVLRPIVSAIQSGAIASKEGGDQ